MSELGLVIATRRWDGWINCYNSWLQTAVFEPQRVIVYDQDVLPAYQSGLDVMTNPILGFVHDDVMIYGPRWDARVLRQFEDPTVGMVGFAGALRHGSPDLYKTPYELPQLGRFGFRSNMRNAEHHGERFTGVCDVAVLDGFAMFVRRPILDKVGGWPLGTDINYFCYDYWLSCEVRRQGYRIRLVGVDCDHLSGKTASMVQLKDDHAAAHKWLYDHSRDVLPFEVKE